MNFYFSRIALYYKLDGSRNTMEFLRLWENEMNAEFDDAACGELIQKVHTTSLTITPLTVDPGDTRCGNVCQARQGRRSESLSRNYCGLSFVVGFKDEIVDSTIYTRRGK